MRVALGVEYDGSTFHGWQYQDHSSSVQEVVEAALSKVAATPVRVVCAGRTDTGVHALGQVIHFDTQVVRPERAWVLGGNVNLPPQVRLQWARQMPEEFHARFSAYRRAYRYVIYTRNVHSALLARRVTWHHKPLDAARMADAARRLEGEHDFSTFRAQGCQAKSPVRTLYRAEVSRSGDFIYFDVEANAFLHHMVRNLVGVLLAVGEGEREPEWVEELLALRNRTLGGVTAPPDGLYLVRAWYPQEFDLPAAPPPPLFG